MSWGIKWVLSSSSAQQDPEPEGSSPPLGYFVGNLVVHDMPQSQDWQIDRDFTQMSGCHFFLEGKHKMLEVCAVLGWFEHTQLEYCDPTTSQDLKAHSWLCFGFIIPHQWLWLGEELSHQELNHNLMFYHILSPGQLSKCTFWEESRESYPRYLSVQHFTDHGQGKFGNPWTKHSLGTPGETKKSSRAAVVEL